MTSIPLRYPRLSRPVMSGLLAILLIGIYLAFPVLHLPTRLTENKPTPPIPCSSQDVNYCDILRRVVDGATAGDFSLLLTIQRPITTVCQQDGPSCKPAPVTPRLYGVVKDKRLMILTHNKYITFFRTQVNSGGTLRYTGAVCSLKSCDATFLARHVHLLLPLQHSSDGWYLSTPSVRTS